MGNSRWAGFDEGGARRSEILVPAASRGQSRRLRASLLTLLLGASLVASPALADRYDATDAGHPLRIVSYVLHPVGVILDYLIFRPAHWLGSREPIRTLVGHKGRTSR